MERRKENRISFETNLTLRILGDGALDLHGQTLDVSAGGMRFLSPAPVAPSTAFRIDRPDGIILGEVCHCSPAPDNQFYLGLVFHQALANLRDLEPFFRIFESDEEQATSNRQRKPSPR